ncbi:hypothetical protein TNCV_2818801 [Trichonephila clavipes]|nr:hypothetical protein TNCV_2818801 [Trichonephila clavipes]
MIVKATRYMRNDDIRDALKINNFKAHIQKIAINFFTDLHATNNVNMQNLTPYTPKDNTKKSPHWTCVSQFSKSQPPGQAIGVNYHFTKHPTREQPLSSQSCQKTLKISHPDEVR